MNLWRCLTAMFSYNTLTTYFIKPFNLDLWPGQHSIPPVS